MPDHPTISPSRLSAVTAFRRPFVAPPRIAYGIRQLDIVCDANIRAKTRVQPIWNHSAVYHFTTWADTKLLSGIADSLVFAPADLDFLVGEHLRDLISNSSSPSSIRVNFERPFVTPPRVVVFFNHIDLDKWRDWRLATTTTNIDTNGFTLHIDTWGDTKLFCAGVGWIAYPEDRPYIFSTSVSTQGNRPQDASRHRHSNEIDFADVGFLKTPDVFVAFNQFDFSHHANLRLKGYVDCVTKNGMTWHIETWADTVLHSAGLSIIAVN